MALRSTSRPPIRGRVIPRVPATLQTTDGLEVSKENGVWTFGHDWTQLAQVSVTDAASQQVLVFNATTDVYARVSFQSMIDASGGGAIGSNTAPAMDGVAAAGVSTSYSRGDHVHPTDTSRAAISHTHTAANVTDFSEAVDDRVGSLLVAGTNVALTYNDAAGTLTIDAASGGGGSGSGDVTGPASSVADRIAVYNGITGKIIKDGGATIASLAPLASPTFTGDPKAPTPAVGDNDTSIATTAFVTAYAAPFDAMAYSGMQINGGMDISQERGTTATSTNATYVCDGWQLYRSGTSVVTAQQWTAGGFVSGFVNYLSVQVSTAEPSIGAGSFVLINQPIEGWRVAKLGWGTASAKPITIGFWTDHHRPGLYSVVVRNGVASRNYVTTYTQNTADVPQYNVVTIPGDTTGTWATDNTSGIMVGFTVACGSTYHATVNTWGSGNLFAASGQVNGVGATTDVFRITGITVLPGTLAPTAAQSPLLMRSYGDELEICQRYFETYIAPYSQVFASTLQNSAATYYTSTWYTRVRKRAAPTFGLMSGVTWNTTPNAINVGVDGVIFTHNTASFVLQATANSTAAYLDARLV